MKRSKNIFTFLYDIKLKVNHALNMFTNRRPIKQASSLKKASLRVNDMVTQLQESDVRSDEQ